MVTFHFTILSSPASVTGKYHGKIGYTMFVNFNSDNQDYGHSYYQACFLFWFWELVGSSCSFMCFIDHHVFPTFALCNLSSLPMVIFFPFGQRLISTIQRWDGGEPFHFSMIVIVSQQDCCRFFSLLSSWRAYTLIAVMVVESGDRTRAGCSNSI